MSTSVEVVCILPLTYFQSTKTFYYTKGRFDFSNGITIRKIESEEIKKIQGQKEYPLNHFDIERVNYTLEKKLTLDDPSRFDKVASEFDKVTNEFLTLVLSMRLFKQGEIGYKAAFLLVDGRRYIDHDFNLKPRKVSIVPLLKREKGEPFIFPRYSLLENEFTKLDVFYQTVIKALGSSEKEWPLPVRYFSRMYQDRPIQDILVDCIIAFEALALKGEPRLQTKKIALALSISMLIGKNSKEREKIKTTIKEAYRVRNSVVHGDSPLSKTPPEIEYLCWESEKYLRRSIQRIFIEELLKK